MFCSKLSEIYWEIVELLNEKCSGLLELRAEFLSRRCNLYASAINNAGASLEDCVGFVHCTKIQMAHPGCYNTFRNQCNLDISDFTAFRTKF